MSGVNPIAGAGFASGAGAYVHGRPGYPPDAADWLRERLGIAPGSVVAEVGAGTGKFTALIAETGATVTAIDPVPEMLAELHAALPNVPTAVASAEALPLADASVDAVVCATAFHWFASAATLAEFRRVLRPGGALGLIWNTRDISVGWVATLSALTNRHQGAAPRETDSVWRAVFPAPGFGTLRETVMHYAYRGSAENVVLARTLSTSFIAALPEGAKAEVAAEVRALIARTPELSGQGEISFPYVTRAYDCRRVD